MGRIRDRLMDIRRTTLIADVMKAGNVTHEVAEIAVRQVESKHPVLDWLRTIDWASLVKLALALLPLILNDGKPEPRENKE